MVNYLNYFGLKNDYTREELKKAYREKINTINSLVIPDIDKKFFMEQSYKLYKQAKHNLYGSISIWRPTNMFFEMDNFLNNMNNMMKVGDGYSYSSYKSYSEKLNNDNSRTVVETIKTNKNGVENVTTNTYKKFPDGRIEPIKPTNMLTDK